MKNERFNQVVAFVVGAGVFQIARSLGVPTFLWLCINPMES